MPPITKDTCGAFHMDGCALKQAIHRDVDCPTRSRSKSNRSNRSGPSVFCFVTRDNSSLKSSECDKENLSSVLHSVCLAKQSGWYYGECSSREAKHLLQDQAVGTFIMRNSADPKYLFALSVRTERGPTSVRISHSGGYFQIDCEEHLKDKMPRCQNIVELVNFHMTFSNSSAFRECCFLERSGNKDLVILKKPRRKYVPSLAHLARLSINLTLYLPNSSVGKLPVAKSVQNYLEEYPYVI